MQHPERLGWAATLPEGYYLDELGQVRHRDSGDLVCGWSGRGHRIRLYPLPVPDPISGTVLRVWIDSKTAREFGRAVRKDTKAAVAGGLRGAARQLLEGLVEHLVGKVIR